jgi:hypothetical protein
MKWTETSASHVAAVADRTPQAVSQWLRKGDIPSLDVIFTIEDGLGVRRGLLARYVEPSLGVPMTEPTPEQMFTEALLRSRLTDKQRKQLSEMLTIYLEFNRSTGTEPPPALPEP